MGKILERKKRKKKGRPSLLDLQKRNLKQQQQLRLNRQHKQHPNTPNPNSNISTPHSSQINNSATPALLRRSSRRIPTSSSSSSVSAPETLRHEDAQHARLNEKRRKKKLNPVLKLPSSSQKSDTVGEDDGNSASNQRKRKIQAIGDGLGDTEKEDKSASATSPASTVRDSGTSTPLPDKKLLLFVLDRLQKKDTYGVFSEPVDLNELPDYHEVIEHPMDFGTVRMKLSGGSYTNLEQFEKDVLLICSNAMQYNAPDTIYFRQARSIQELAKKSFENLRQDSDNNEPEPKVVRRGRPPTKNIKKQLGRPSLDRSGSEFSSDATLASGAVNPTWSVCNLGKEPYPAGKCGVEDLSGRSHGSQNDAYRWIENKYDRIDEGSMSKGNSSKHGKKLFALDDSRRNTYKQFHQSVVGRGQTVLATFDAERKRLMAVGLLSEHGYARSLSRFAANVGEVAWEIATRRIKRSLVPGFKFGPGWVGENDIPPQRLFLQSQTFPVQQTPSQPPFALLESSCAAATACSFESREQKTKSK